VGQVAFAMVAPIETWNGPAVLCALRREMPFDALDVVAATSAAQLLALMASDGRDLAGAQQRAAEMDSISTCSAVSAGSVNARDATAVWPRRRRGSRSGWARARARSCSSRATSFGYAVRRASD
jgi:hypothetical protein